MKKVLMLCVAGAVALTSLFGCTEKSEVTAIVAGPGMEVVALEIEYDYPINPESVSPEAYAVEGKEIAFVKVKDQDDVLLVFKRDCKGPKHECGEKPECDKKPECGEKPACDKAEGECQKAEGECEKAEGECAEAAAEKPCCKEEGPDHKCTKPEDQKCDKCKAAEGKPAPKPEGKPGRPGKKVVPKIAVQQVAPITDAYGNTVKAWKKPIKATDVEFAHRGGKHHHHGDKPCGGQHECGDKPCQD